jgi:hypothetical protein
MTTGVFIVGCPRSGTTLLQAILSAHPGVFTLPETFFFQALRPVGAKQRALRRVGLVSPRRGNHALTKLQQILGSTAKASPPFVPTLRGFVNSFREYLELHSQQFDLWVEKSPNHLYHLDTITKYIPTAKVIHITRNGCDVVGSLFNECQRDPRMWVKQVTEKTNPSRAELIDGCVTRWKRDIAISARYSAAPLHLIVSYDDLVTELERTGRLVCEHVGLDFDDALLHHETRAKQQLGAYVEAPQTERALAPVANGGSNHFERLFSEAEQQEIRGRLGAACQFNV